MPDKYQAKLSITIVMFVSTIIVGGVVWYVSDIFQTEKLSGIFKEKLTERFARQAQDERTAFDKYIKAHHQAIKLISNSSRLQKFVSSNGELLDQSNEDIKIYKRPPEWLPRMSSLRSLVQPRYILLFNKNKELREIYTGYEELPPEEITKPSELLLQLSHHQSYMTMVANKPYLLTSEFIGGSGNHNSQRKAIIMMAAPIDSSFLVASQGVKGDVSIIALLTEDRQRILESSHHDLIPVGESLEVLRDRYLMNGHGFFDYGSSFAIEFVSFISPEEIKQLTGGILSHERQARIVTAIAYISSFSLIIFWITGRIRRLTRKIREFSDDMEIQQPDSDFNSGDQIDVLERRFQYLSSAVKEKKDTLEYQALHDNLTELPNRKYLNDHIQKEIMNGKKRGRTRRKKFVLILGDLNRFKEINDTLGHHIGDVVLQQVSERLSQTFRKSDIVARLGGDEFGILLPDTSIDEAVSILDSLYGAFDIPFVVERHYLSVGVSLGITEFPVHGDDVNILLKRADIAMYRAKNTKCLYTVYDQASDPHTEGKLALTAELRLVIERKDLDVYYQPKVDFKTGKITSAEALIRWNHPVRGFIPPDDFIPLAEQTGLIKPLTELVLEKALLQRNEWKTKGLDVSMAINISPHCLHDWNLSDIIRTIIRKYNISPGECVLELTESAIMANPMRAREILREIDAMGIVLSIDDFGTGYSSLAYLKELPLNELKIDRIFVKEMSKNESDAAIVKATISMAHTLGLKVVAEGIEDKETWDLLKELGCDIGQGYYMGKPMPAEEFYNTICNNPESQKVRVRV